MSNYNFNGVCPALPYGLFVASFFMLPIYLSGKYSIHDKRDKDKEKDKSITDGNTNRRNVKLPIISTLGDYFDHTLLKPDATIDQIINLCNEAITYDFASVCINSIHIPTVMNHFVEKNSNIRICSVIGFPLGAISTTAKIAETKCSIENGANEIDMVLQIGLLKSQLYEEVFNDILAVVDICHNKHHHNKLVQHLHNSVHPYVTCKVIIESCLLSEEEIEIACHLAGKAGADYIKTSTGFSSGGATTEVIELMSNVACQYKRNIPRGNILNSDIVTTMQVKASAGIRNGNTALNMITSGIFNNVSMVTRIGTSSSIMIMKDWEEDGITNLKELNNKLDFLNNSINVHIVSHKDDNHMY